MTNPAKPGLCLACANVPLVKKVTHKFYAMYCSQDTRTQKAIAVAAFSKFECVRCDEMRSRDRFRTRNGKSRCRRVARRSTRSCFLPTAVAIAAFTMGSYSCLSCQKVFSRNADLINHQKRVTANGCRKLYEESRRVAPAQLRNLSADGDLEDDPDFAGDELLNLADGADFPVVLDDNMEGFVDVTPPALAPQHLHVAQALPTDHTPRDREEDILEREPAVRDVYENAGKIYGYDETVRAEYLAAKRNDTINPYAPFNGETDWEVARWLKDEGIGHNATTKFLGIPGVSFVQCTAFRVII